jgi:hypothetical protein
MLVGESMPMVEKFTINKKGLQKYQEGPSKAKGCTVCGILPVSECGASTNLLSFGCGVSTNLLIPTVSEGKLVCVITVGRCSTTVGWWW